MKKKLMMILPIALIAFGGTYKFVLAKPAPAPEPKVHGEVYVVPKDFLVNLAGGRFAKLGVALVIEHGSAAPAGKGGHAPAEPPEGYGLHPQEALVRSIVTDAVTGEEPGHLTSTKGRHELQRQILKRIKKSTDVKVEEVLFTDIAVQ